jgi:ketosteroid isomerase-like protein
VRPRWDTVVLAAGAVLPTLYGRAVEVVFQHNLTRLRAGDPGPQSRFYAKDVRFTFPGDSSWGGTIEGKDELRRWLDRFVEAGLQLHADEVVISGPAWKTTFCIRATVHADDDSGRRVYENRAVLWGRMRWGLVHEYEVYEDTHRTEALDRHLAEVGRAQPG